MGLHAHQATEDRGMTYKEVEVFMNSIKTVGSIKASKYDAVGIISSLGSALWCEDTGRTIALPSDWLLLQRRLTGYYSNYGYPRVRRGRGCTDEHYR